MWRYVCNVICLLLLGLLCARKAPKAWENSKRISHNPAVVSIPFLHKKQPKKPFWYVSPKKALRPFSQTLSEIAHVQHNYKELKKRYDTLKRASYRINKSSGDAHTNENMPKNRYKGLIPYDATRTCREIHGFYINANDVHTPVQSYLVTQGPLEETIGDFWKAVLHKNSPLIITLVMEYELGKEKCASFWTKPLVQTDGWTICLQSEREVAVSCLIPSHRIVLRTFKASSDRLERTIQQIHYENWPDGKTPDLELFEQLLDEADKYSGASFSPITVHCSAGLGRSGTFVAAHSLRKEIRQTQSRNPKQQTLRVNIPKAIFYLRCQRMGLVGTSHQFQTVYQTLAKEHQKRRTPLFIF